MQMAKQGHCPPFEWQRRNKDGSLHWDEVRLKPAMIDGRPHILAFTPGDHGAEGRRWKSCASERSSTAPSSRVRWTACSCGTKTCASSDVNPAGLALYGYRREDVIGRTFPTQHARGLRQGAHADGAARDGRRDHATSRPPCCGPTAPPSTPTCGSCRSRSAAGRMRLRSCATSASGAAASANCSAARPACAPPSRPPSIASSAWTATAASSNSTRAAERVFGYRREDVLGRMLSGVLMPERHRAAHIRALESFGATAERGKAGGGHGAARGRQRNPGGGCHQRRRRARGQDLRGPSARHHRAPARRPGAARQRGAVPRDLQRLGRRAGAARRRFQHRRRQRRPTRR